MKHLFPQDFFDELKYQNDVIFFSLVLISLILFNFLLTPNVYVVITYL